MTDEELRLWMESLYGLDPEPAQLLRIVDSLDRIITDQDAPSPQSEALRVALTRISSAMNENNVNFVTASAERRANRNGDIISPEALSRALQGLDEVPRERLLNLNGGFVPATPIQPADPIGRITNQLLEPGQPINTTTELVYAAGVRARLSITSTGLIFYQPRGPFRLLSLNDSFYQLRLQPIESNNSLLNTHSTNLPIAITDNGIELSPVHRTQILSAAIELLRSYLNERLRDRVVGGDIIVSTTAIIFDPLIGGIRPLELYQVANGEEWVLNNFVSPRIDHNRDIEIWLSRIRGSFGIPVFDTDVRVTPHMRELYHEVTRMIVPYTGRQGSVRLHTNGSSAFNTNLQQWEVYDSNTGLWHFRDIGPFGQIMGEARLQLAQPVNVIQHTAWLEETNILKAKIIELEALVKKWVPVSEPSTEDKRILEI